MKQMMRRQDRIACCIQLSYILLLSSKKCQQLLATIVSTAYVSFNTSSWPEAEA
jgi:hypothetical protein